MTNLPLALSDIRAAAARIQGAVYRSPCPYSLSLSRLTGCEIYCKLDHLQLTGSFKERGARNKLMQLSDAQIRDLLAAGYTGAFMGADGLADSDFIKSVGSSADLSKVYSTLVGLPVAKLTGPGATWYATYNSRWPNENNQDFAPFGYEAARVAISAIAKANKKDREAIRAAVASTTSADLGGPSILGDWKFDTNGDTSLVTISVQQVQGATWNYQGIMSYNSQTKVWTFQKQ